MLVRTDLACTNTSQYSDEFALLNSEVDALQRGRHRVLVPRELSVPDRQNLRAESVSHPCLQGHGAHLVSNLELGLLLDNLTSIGLELV